MRAKRACKARPSGATNVRVLALIAECSAPLHAETALAEEKDALEDGLVFARYLLIDIEVIGGRREPTCDGNGSDGCTRAAGAERVPRQAYRIAHRPVQRSARPNAGGDMNSRRSTWLCRRTLAAQRSIRAEFEEGELRPERGYSRCWKVVRPTIVFLCVTWACPGNRKQKGDGERGDGLNLHAFPYLRQSIGAEAGATKELASLKSFSDTADSSYASLNAFSRLSRFAPRSGA